MSALRHSATSLEHLVGRDQQARWHREAERSRCLQVDRGLVFGRRQRRCSSSICQRLAVEILMRSSADHRKAVPNLSVRGGCSALPCCHH